MKGSAILTLLKAQSQNNSYAQAVHGTYLMATGAQRQHFSVLSSLGLSMAYTSIINQHTGQTKKQVDIEEAISTAANGPAPLSSSLIDNTTYPVPHELPNTTEGAAPVTNPEVVADSNQSEKKKKKKRTLGTLYQLSNACRTTARLLAATRLLLFVYDNINMMIRIAEQIIGRKSKFYYYHCRYLKLTVILTDAQENGTCATAVPLHNATLEELSAERHNEGVMNAPPLKLSNLELTEAESCLLHDALVHTILSVIVKFGGEGFQRWKGDLEDSWPKSNETIDVHLSTVHPLPTMEIDENSTTGNVEVIEAINAELRINTDSPDYVKYVTIIAGDQLTIARQRSILNVRTVHESGADAWKHIVLMPGLFHAKIADCHGILQTHLGRSSTHTPESLAFHNTRLDRLPILLSSLPPFRTSRDLIFVSFYARIRDCLLRVSGQESLEDYLANVTEWCEVQEHAKKIIDLYANADRVLELREARVADERRREVQQKAEEKNTAGPHPTTRLPHIPKGDMVFENACLFLRDVLLSRLFSDAIKSGDSGLIILVLKMWSFSYRGSGRSKYAHEMLHLLHNLINVWSSDLRCAHIF